MNLPWYEITNVAEISSPSLLLYPERIEKNLKAMIRAAGCVTKLRPHVKTHKMSKIVELKLAMGITKFKASTIAEVEMVLRSGGKDVLLAYPLVGPNIERLLTLIQSFPNAIVSALVDNMSSAGEIAKAAREKNVVVPLFMDLNVGMNRTGIIPGPDAAVLYRTITSTGGLLAAGFHAYDGHLHATDAELLLQKTNDAFAPVWQLRDSLEQAGFDVPTIIASGTPTSELLAKFDNVEVGAGTTVLWDAGVPTHCPEMPYLPAAVLLARVISKPAKDLLCVDLGHKAVASEFPHPRVSFFGLEDAVAVTHSEEHLVLKIPRADEYAVGRPLYGLPFHVCPTVALYSDARCVRDHVAGEAWPVTARNRFLTV